MCIILLIFAVLVGYVCMEFIKGIEDVNHDFYISWTQLEFFILF